MARWSGELAEYMRVASAGQAGDRFSAFEMSLLESSNPYVWLEGLKIYTRRWVEQHRYGSADRWTTVRSDRSQGEDLRREGLKVEA